MLKRINEIKTVGCFINERAASLQFEKLTFVYGENCYGKSTLCDIFRSLAENNPNLITKRLTVPNPNSENQIVNFNFTFPTTESETPFIFRNNAWESTLPDCPILVFDTDFIHRNVFTGLTIERRNEENITQFVLGESSVEIARQISLLNSTLRQINRDIREIESSSLNNITDIPAFVSLIVSESQETYSEQISTIGVELQQQRQLAENINSTISRSEPNRLREIPDINQFISRFNECISSSLQRIHENASERVLEHIRTHCQDSPIAENWLRTGINLLNESTCPFCGQQFSQDAINLIQNYREHFNDAFDQFERQIIQQIDQLIRELSNFQMLDLLELIQTNRDSLNAYPELLNSQRFSQELGRLNSEVSQFTLVLREWRQLYEHFSSQIFEALRLKRENIFRALGTIDLSNLNFKYQAIIQYIDRYNQIIQSLVNYISEFKRGLTPQKINQAISTLEVQQADTNRRLARIQLNGVCTRYNSLISQRTETSDRIAELNEELDLYQADYLDNYFEKINSLFSQLGSNNFTIRSNVGRRGNMPVIQLAASFKGVEITRDELTTFFSESDRRALALAIYIAKIDSMTADQQSKSILVLDDPVTSFDDGRIDRTIRLIEAMRNRFRQLIILSHYPKYLKSFFQRAYSSDGNIKLLKIVSDSEGSHLQLASSTDFVETEHYIKFKNIIGFIDRTHQNDVQLDLRIYLETEVRLRYRMQIEQNNLLNIQFGDLVAQLFTLEIITQDTREEIDSLRQSLNVDHHVWTSRAHEEKIGIASDTINFIYSRL